MAGRQVVAPRRFRKKPVVIEAVQWDGTNYRDVYDLYDSEGDKEALQGAFGALLIPTLEGDMEASPGDWIIKGIKGEFYPCKPDIFEATYEPAD